MIIKRFIGTLTVVLAGFGSSVHASEVVVSAAASLTSAFKDMVAQFELEHPGIKILPSFAASDVLMQQIMNGAPVDIFASADPYAMDRAAEAGVIELGSRQDFVLNELVLIVPAQDHHAITSVDDLAAASITRIAFGNPNTVPAGRYTQAALEQSGHWARVKSKQILGQNVRQVLDYVARGEVDAGFVFATDAAIMPDKVTVVQVLSSPVPVRYPIALVKRDTRSADAVLFFDYLLSDKGQAILQNFGFAKP